MIIGYRNRAKRCRHGFLSGLCTVKTCPAWDKRDTPESQSLTIVHESWGRGRQRRTREGVRR